MNSRLKSQVLVWWMLWAAFQAGIFVIYFVFAKTPPPGEPAGSVAMPWMIAFAPVALSILVRWGLLPRATSPQAALPLFIIGIALAEASCFFGLFLFPEHKQELFAASAVGIFQFLPCYANRFYE